MPQGQNIPLNVKRHSKSSTKNYTAMVYIYLLRKDDDDDQVKKMYYFGVCESDKDNMERGCGQGYG